MTKQQAGDLLADALAGIRKEFGSGAIITGDTWRDNVPVIPTGSVALDYALGIGGLPRGRVVEVFGPEGSGKTSLSLHVAANAQRAGGRVLFIDAEHALDPDYAKAIGVDMSEGHWYLSQPDTGEQGLEIADRLVRTSSFAVVVIDSVAALVPRAEIEGDMGDTHIGLQARLMSQALRKLAGALDQTSTLCIFINQLREKVGVVFGNPEVTTGGRALKFYSSVRLDIRATETLKIGTESIGKRTRVKVVKNKMSAPFRQAEFDILFGQGISRYGELLDLGVQYDLLRKTGAWYYAGETALGNGKEAARATLKASPELADGLEQSIRTALAARLAAPPAPVQEEVPVRGTGRKLEAGDFNGPQ